MVSMVYGANPMSQSSTLALEDATWLTLSSLLDAGFSSFSLLAVSLVLLSPGKAVEDFVRLSVQYQPEPLKTIPTGCSTRRT